MLSADQTQALAARARTAARAVVGLVLAEDLASRFVHGYTRDYRRLGIAGEAEHKAELVGAVERESLLLVAARIESSLPHAAGARFSRQAEAEAVAGFRHAFLTFLGGSLAWDNDEREAFRRDLGMYLRLAARERRAPGVRRGPVPAGVFVDRCAFLVDPSMMGQAREAAARYQAALESCATEALRAAFRGFRPRRSRAARPAHVRKSSPHRRAVSRRKSAPPHRKRASTRKSVRRKKPARSRRRAGKRASARRPRKPSRRQLRPRRKPAPRKKRRPVRPKRARRAKSPRRKSARHTPPARRRKRPRA